MLTDKPTYTIMHKFLPTLTHILCRHQCVSVCVCVRDTEGEFLCTHQSCQYALVTWSISIPETESMTCIQLLRACVCVCADEASPQSTHCLQTDTDILSNMQIYVSCSNFAFWLSVSFYWKPLALALAVKGILLTMWLSCGCRPTKEMQLQS